MNYLCHIGVCFSVAHFWSASLSLP
jgi:hypothetical protein